MRKTYIVPDMTVVEIEPERILAGSDFGTTITTPTRLEVDEEFWKYDDKWGD